MSPYWFIAFIVWSVGLVIGGGVAVHWHDGAVQDKADQAIIAEQKKNAALQTEISASYEAGKQKGLSERLSSTIQLSKPNVSYSSCHVLPADRRLLQGAVTAANAAK